MSLIGIIPKRWLTAYVTETEAKALLRGASLRVTRPRVAVLSAVHEAPHSEASTLLTLVRTRIGAVSTQAVRRAQDARRRGTGTTDRPAEFRGTVRGPVPGQPSARGLPLVRHDRRRRCPAGRPASRDARGSRVHRGPRRGDVLGPVSRMPGRAWSAGSGVGAPKSSRRGAGKFLT